MHHLFFLQAIYVYCNKMRYIASHTHTSLQLVSFQNTKTQSKSVQCSSTNEQTYAIHSMFWSILAKKLANNVQQSIQKHTYF